MKRMWSFLTIPNILIFVGVVMAAVGSLWSAADQAKSGKEAEKINAELIAKNNAISAQNVALAAKSDEIAKLTAKLSTTVTNTVTGGDGFCYVSLGNFGNANAAPVIVASEGNYPLYDVVVTLVDLDKKLTGYTWEEVQRNRTNITIGTMTPGAVSLPQQTIALPPNGSLNYNIFISARNGLFSQMLRGRKVNGRWLFASNVSTQGDDTTPEKQLWEKVDKGFPVKQGKVEWNAYAKPAKIASAKPRNIPTTTNKQ